MQFTRMPVKDCYLIDIEPHADARGFFARTFCAREFAAQGLCTGFVQANASYNERAGTLRGLHFQHPPQAEVKLVRCTRGALFDVVVDLRRDSPSYGRWAGAELSADNHRALYVPQGCAHGFQTLVDDTEAFYLVSAFYAPDCEGGLSWRDPAVGIDWPMAPTSISPKDTNWPTLEELAP